MTVRGVASGVARHVGRGAIGHIGGLTAAARAAALMQTYLGAVSDAGGTVSNADQTSIQTFLEAGYTNRWMNHILDMGVFAGDFTAALVKVVDYNDGATPTLGNTNFVSGDYSSTLGLKGGSGKLLDTHFNYQTYGTNVLGHSFYLNEDVPRDDGVYSFMGRSNNVGAPYWQIYSSGNGPAGALGGSFPTMLNSVGIARGLLHSSIITTSSVKARQNGQVYFTDSTPFTDDTPDTTCRLFEVAATCPFYGSFYAIDDGQMDDATALAFYLDVQQLQLALGRKVTNPVAGKQRYTFSIGQSLAIGISPRLSTTQPYQNRGFNQNRPGYFDGTFYFCIFPYTEGGTESHSAGAVNLASELWRADHADDASMDLLVSNFAISGTLYYELKKGGTQPAYAASIASVAPATTLSADYYTDGLIVPFIMCVHGEGDYFNASYEANLVEWQSDYEADIQAITGQTEPVVLLTSQPSNAWSAFAATANSPLAVLAAHVNNPGKIVCVCPKYFFPFSDLVHLTNIGYQWFGEFEGKAINALNRGLTYEPLRPSSVVRTGAEIVVSFVGRVGALQFDTTTVVDPGDYGFEWEQTGGSAQTISSVALFNSDTQIKITLSGDPGSPTTQKLRYGFQDLFTSGPSDGGPITGPRGCLKDSDPTVSPNGYNLANWCVHFIKDVT